jgi:hypothetical protein
MTAGPARRSLVLLATAGLTAGLVPALSGSAMALTSTTVEVTAEGLDNPRGLDVVAPATGTEAPEVLFVAENGTGGDAPCVQAGDPEDPADPASAPQMCFGPTGQITMVDLDSGEQRVVVDELPSLALKGGGGNEATGPADVSVVPGSYTGDAVSLRIVIGLGADPAQREELGEQGAALGTLIGADVDLTEGAEPAGEGDWTVLADIAAFEAENDPVPSTDPETGEPGGPDSNPHSVLAQAGRTLVVDAGGNTLLSVDESAPVPLPVPGLGDPTYEVALAEAFDEEREAPAPPFLGAPPGTMIAYETVPTSISEIADGTDEDTEPDLVVGELTGFPFPVGAANVYEVDAVPGTDPEVLDAGHSTIGDVAERDDDLFIAEFGHTGLLAEAPVGAVVRDRPEGGEQALLLGRLSFPGGVVVDSAGLVHVTNNGIEAGTGEVLTFDPSLAGDPAIQAACDPEEVVWPEFGDTEASVHEEAIACLAWWDIIRGTSANAFSPGQRISRAQTASLLARLLDATDRPAAESTNNYFDDDNGSTHEANINRLAAAGVVRGKTDRRYAPTLDVTRAELATLAVRAYERVTGQPLPTAGNAFTDDDPSVHHDAINKAAAMGWVGGYGGGRFGPSDPVTRAQASSLLARMLSDLVEEGLAERTEQ